MYWSGRRGSNSRPSAWKADALSTELLPLVGKGCRPPLRQHGPLLKPLWLRGRRWIRTTEGINQQIYSLPHLATLVSSRYFKDVSLVRVSIAGADGGIRTPDQLITNQLLWPTELHRQNRPFWIAKVGIKILSSKLSGINFLFFALLKEPGDKTPVIRREIGCKFRKSFEYHNSFMEKYHRFGLRDATSRSGGTGDTPVERSSGCHTIYIIKNPHVRQEPGTTCRLTPQRKKPCNHDGRRAFCVLAASRRRETATYN